MLKTIFIGYLILMSLFTLFLFGIDKQKARHHKGEYRNSDSYFMLWQEEV